MSGSAPPPPEIGAARPLPDLDAREFARYSRHVILPEVGLDGQRRLKRASVLCVGTGGLGAPVGLYLAAAGVGRLGLVDFNVVDESNLQRQVIHGTRDIGRPKLDSARDRLHDVNPNVEIATHPARLTAQNALAVLADYDIVVDGTDNFPTRYLVNNACVLLGKPNVYGSIFRFEGQASVFWAARGPCYRCLYPEPPPPGMVPSCAEGGVLGVLPGIIGMIQATETLKLILGVGDSLIGRLVLFDALAMRFRELKLRKNDDCPVCGKQPTVTKLIDYEQFCGVVAAPTLDIADEILPRALAARLAAPNPPVVVDVRNPEEWRIAHIAGATHIRLGDLGQRLGELDPAAEIVVYCRTGVRSAKALVQLRAAGFQRVQNLVGGIHRWSDDVDGSIPKY